MSFAILYSVRKYHMVGNSMLHPCGAFTTRIAALVIFYCILRVYTLHAFVFMWCLWITPNPISISDTIELWNHNVQRLSCFSQSRHIILWYRA